MAKVVRRPGTAKIEPLMQILAEVGTITYHELHVLTGWTKCTCSGALLAAYQLGWVYVVDWRQDHEGRPGLISRVWAIGVGKRDKKRPDSKTLRAKSQRRYRDKIKVLFNRKMARKKGLAKDVMWIALTGRMQ